MLRLLACIGLLSSGLAVAQTAPPVPSQPPVAPEAPVAPAAPEPEAEAAPVAAADEGPKMKRVCHSVDVVGSAFPRRVCTMKPVRAPRDKG